MFTRPLPAEPGNPGAHGITVADLLLGGTSMVFARFAPMVTVLAVAGAHVLVKEGDDIAWLLRNAPGEVLVVRPAEARRVSAAA